MNLPLPESLQGFYSKNSEKCDMALGPCACGAWHHESCWERREKQDILNYINDMKKIKEGFDLYQQYAIKTAIYPNLVVKESNIDVDWAYLGLGLSGEVGELNEKLKKIIRDKKGEVDEERKRLILKEVNDATWYLANICEELQLSFGHGAVGNLLKLNDRKERGKLSGSGDER